MTERKIDNNGITIRSITPCSDPDGVIALLQCANSKGIVQTKGLILPQTVGAHIREGFLTIPNPASTDVYPLRPLQFSLPVILNGGGEGGKILKELKPLGIRVLSGSQIKQERVRH